MGGKVDRLRCGQEQELKDGEEEEESERDRW